MSEKFPTTVTKETDNAGCEFISGSKEQNIIEQKISEEKIDPKKNFYTKTQKATMVSEQLDKLRTAFKQLDPNTYNVVQNLIESVAFMSVELKDLEGVINNNGQIETYRNGAYQTGYKQSAASAAYNSMKKTYLADIKLLADLIGANAKDFNDELMDFIRKK